MNISMYTQNTNPENMYQRQRVDQKKAITPAITESCNKKDNTGLPNRSSQMRQLLRDLEKPMTQPQNPYVAFSAGKTNGFLDLSVSSEDEKNETHESTDYNYKEVETKIQRAKNSVSAGQAVLSAKRKTVEIRRKIAAGNGDPEELQLALTHAKRIELAAKKKKHHLEIEELVEITRKRDERLEESEKTSSDIAYTVISAAEDKLSEVEDKIFDERKELMDEVFQGTSDNSGTSSDDTNALSEEEMQMLNEMIAEFGDEELQELEEPLELLENLEIIDPHMSKEELDDLKRKHRAAEEKAIMKADMDYLGEAIKLQMSKLPDYSTPGLVSGGAVNISV